MANALEIQRTLVLSTSHLKPETVNTIRNSPILEQQPWFPWDVDEYNMEWYVPDVKDAVGGINVYLSSIECPEDVAAGIRLAYFNGCQWVRFDQDGPTTEELTTYDW